MADDENLEEDAKLPEKPEEPDNPEQPDNPNNPGGDDNNTSTTGNPRVVGEAIAYMGLPSAGIEQTRSMMQAVSDKVSATKVYYSKCCGFYDYVYNYGGLGNAWVNPVYSYGKVKSPYDYEAEISGLEAGFDIQSDVNHRLGVFASFRQGEYDFDGRGDDYMSKVGSTIDIDSYILGLYHRYDAGKAWVMSQVFAGYQDVDFDRSAVFRARSPNTELLECVVNPHIHHQVVIVAAKGVGSVGKTAPLIIKRHTST